MAFRLAAWLKWVNNERMTKRISSLFLILLGFGACQKSAPVVVQAAVAAVPAPVELSRVVTKSPGLVEEIHFAVFENSTLAECSEVAVNVTPPVPLPPGWVFNDPINAKEGLEKAANAKKGTRYMAINGTCAETFSDRPVLASCTRSIGSKQDKAGATYTLSGTTNWYGPSVLENDAMMMECMELKGKWTAVRRDSREAVHARLQGHGKRLQALTDKL